MKRPLLLVLFFLGLAAAAWGQQQSVAEPIIITFPLDQVQTNAQSDPIRNIGQTQHSVFIRLEDAPGGGTCTDAGLSVFFEQGVVFKDDTATIQWEQFGPELTATEYGALNSAYRLNTSGAVNFIRVNPAGFDTAECLLSATYVGSVRPVTLFDIGAQGVTNIYYFASAPTCGASDHFIYENTTDGLLYLCSAGTITAVGSGGGVDYVDLFITDAVLPDGTTSNSPGNATVEKGTVTGTDPFWYAIELGQFDRAMWSIRIPDNFDSAPIFTALVHPSTAIGTFSYSVGVRCITLDANESVYTNDFAALNTDATITFNGADEGATIEIALANSDSMAAGDWCTFDFVQNSSGIATFLLQARLTYTTS